MAWLILLTCPIAAGLAAAIACARQNFAVTVLERSSGLSPHGDSILFGSNASKLLHRWGVGKDMYKRGASHGKWIFKSQQGEDIWVEDVDELCVPLRAFSRLRR